MYVRILASAALLLGLSGSAHSAPTPITGRDFLVVLDPGHGGTNEGCQSSDGALREKTLTLELAEKLREVLKTRLPRARVRLTRDADVTMTLAERTRYANAVDADLLVSIHLNASPNHDQTGFETFVLQKQTSDLDVIATAERENDGARYEPHQADPVRAMVLELKYNENRLRAGVMAVAIQREQAEYFPERHNRGVRQGPFDVLMGARMPAVLTEVGFLDHRDEGRQLRAAEVQDRIAVALANALTVYYRNVVLRD